MTWVVYVLLALNLGLLTWNLHTRTASGTVASSQTSEPALAVVNQLPLLTELDEDALRPRARAKPRADSPREPLGVAGPSESAAIENPTQPPVASAGDVATADDAPSPSVVPGNARAVPVTGNVPAPRATTDDSGLIAHEPVPRACLTLGPLGADAPVAQIRAWLQQVGATVDVRTDERREVALYWVYFPPRITREQAVTEVERLRAEGVKDVIAVPKGDMANAISLGVFSRTDGRDRRVREMNQRGYQPSVAPRYRVTLATWVDVSAPVDAVPEQEIQTRWPGLEFSRKPCEIGSAASVEPATQTIAVGQGASYNTPLSAPRLFHFSGSNAARSSDAAEPSR